MTTQDIIKQTESFTIEQKQELAYYFLFSTISEEKIKEFANLFNDKGNYNTTAEQFLNAYSEEDNIHNTIDKLCGSGKNLWKEDAQVYINKSREDDRQF